MAKKTEEPKIKLKQPDRTAAPAESTLLNLASEKNLFEQADRRQQQLDDGGGVENVLPPGTERFLEACLWTFSLATLHLSFDVLVQHQYGTEIRWDHVAFRTATAWFGKFS